MNHFFEGVENKRVEKLVEALRSIPQAPYPSHSRIHPLRKIKPTHGTCFVKRDDELGFGISGSKIRKYRSLLPFLIQKQIQEVVVIGSEHSNHVLGITQLLIESGIKPTLFLKKSHEALLQGNSLFTHLFISPETIHWMDASQWPGVLKLADSYASQQPHPTFVLREGGSVAEALPGALSFPLDILQNEYDFKVQFDHIVIDAGTGLTAMALILAFSWLLKQTSIHVVLIAGDSSHFFSELAFFHSAFSTLLQEPIPFPENFHLYRPSHHASFGSTGPQIWQEIRITAQGEGFLLDPLYGAKLFLEGKHLLQRNRWEGSILFHHGGGALTLAGFQKALRNLLPTTSNEDLTFIDQRI